MSTKAMYKIIHILENEIKIVFEDIENGKFYYGTYLEDTLNAYYSFLEYFNENNTLKIDIEQVKKNYNKRLKELKK